MKPVGQKSNEFYKSGIYKRIYADFSVRYIGQTGRTFKSRFKEHIHTIRKNKQNSKYAQHVLDTGHV
jgi:hypothetical protein